MSSRSSLAGGRDLSRRAFTGLALAGAIAPFCAKASSGLPQEPRFVTPDHGLAQTLLAIGADLSGVAQIPNWDVWTIEPSLPADVVNLGAAQEMNLELLQRLQPDLILSTPYLETVRHQLERIAPVESFPIHALGTSPYPNILTATRRLGELSGRETASEELIVATEHLFETTRPKLSRLRKHPLLFLHFIDTRHVRVYGPNCIIQDVLDRLDLQNGWPGSINGWGFATAGIERLVDIGDAWVLVFDPVPPDVEALLAGSPLWQNLPFVQAGRVRRFPNVLAFGTLPAATRMTRLLTELERDHA